MYVFPCMFDSLALVCICYEYNLCMCWILVLRGAMETNRSTNSKGVSYDWESTSDSESWSSREDLHSNTFGGPSGPQPQAFNSRSSPFSSQSPPFAPEYTLGLQSKDIEHRFFRASESGKEVSRMLEASKIRVGYSDAKGGSAVSDFLAALRLTCCRGNAVLVSHGQFSDKSIAFLLLAAFQTRYKEVLIKAQTAALAVAPKFLTILTKEETKLYEAAQSSMAAFKKWRMGGPRFQKASVLGRKRRPSD
ncbi:hypothetical protein RHGRI_037210 [Rhododendron griersonianum]|uniref:DUF632 domain-containing protein n=1 Tax=Rhododendron griersonianum TaxID=479676 RepID=A0AAV6HRY9_9ERIC|nr:hypothetical protein RHGRI_037210 [Rhododendron griersonianum]